MKNFFQNSRKYEVYNGIDTTDILADEQEYKKDEHGMNGNKIAQCTAYHKVKDEYYYIMNLSSFTFNGTNKYVRLNFSTKELFGHFYNKLKTRHFECMGLIINSVETKNWNVNLKSYRQVHFESDLLKVTFFIL